MRLQCMVLGLLFFGIGFKIYADIIFNGAKNFDIPIHFLDSYIKNI